MNLASEVYPCYFHTAQRVSKKTTLTGHVYQWDKSLRTIQAVFYS